MNIKDYKKAIIILEDITEEEVYSELSKALINAYFDNGEHKKALDLCNKISENSIEPIIHITEIKSVIYESIGALEKAIFTCENYLNIYPEDQLILVRIAFLYARKKEINM
ncbi:MAG: hypothetical protein U5L09_13945 [Bacteroidales bacterium]|nr:hypothetical protein [Bacteroidales bacterium]